MKNSIKANKKNDEKLLMIVLAFMCFSIGVWSNYRQLWLTNNGFDITSISRLFSVALICSAVISFIISLFSTKVNIKSIIVMSILFRSISMTMLLFTKDVFIIKTSMLLGIMCDVIFSIAFYPLLTYVTKSDESYKRKMLIEYFAKDIGIVFCGLLIGVKIGELLFSYDTCLLIALVSSFLSVIVLLFFNTNEDYLDKNNSLKKSFKNIFSSKVNNLFLTNQLIINISYGIVFDLILIILTEYINFEVSLASVFIIVCNVLGSISGAIINKYSDSWSVSKSSIVRFGIRIFGYIIAFLLNDTIGFIIAIIIGYITSRILDNKTTGTFLELIDKKEQFLFGNIKYFAACIGEGIGVFLAGILISISFKYIFMGAIVITIIQIMIFVYLDKLIKK